jgi:hypothetical protein
LLLLNDKAGEDNEGRMKPAGFAGFLAMDPGRGGIEDLLAMG